jgi:hypothetical protein
MSEPSQLPIFLLTVVLSCVFDDHGMRSGDSVGEESVLSVFYLSLSLYLFCRKFWEGCVL